MPLAKAQDADVYARLHDKENGSHNGGHGRLALAAAALDDLFKISARGSTLSIEVRGGCIAWMTMSYILIVNPMILCQASTTADPLSTGAVMTATAFSSAIGSLLMGICSDAPLALMPGMGLNAYFTFGICKALGVTWQQALSCSFASGAVLFVLSMLGACNWMVRVILQDHLKKAITVAIGMFQALIGFQQMGLVVTSPDTLVTMGSLSVSNQHLYLAVAGLCAISVMLVSGKVHGALLIGIWLMAAASWALGLQAPPTGLFDLPSLSSVGAVDFSAWDPAGDKLAGMVGCSLVLLFVALFDLAGVQYGLMGIAGLLKDGHVPRSSAIFASCGMSTMIGALLGTSPVIIANESSAGIAEGARTGLMGIVVALMFFLSAFISPLMSAVPEVATAVPLILVGVFMMSPCKDIEWGDLRVAIPSFLTMTIVPFTYSIHNGIIAGILMDWFLAIFIRQPQTEEALPEKQEPIEQAASTSTLRFTPTSRRKVSSPYLTAVKDPESRVRYVSNLLADLQTAGSSCRQSPGDEGLRLALENYLEQLPPGLPRAPSDMVLG